MLRLLTCLVIVWGALHPRLSLAWGERGHHIVATLAGRSVLVQAPSNRRGKALGQFYSDRALWLGHTSLFPDFLWKDKRTAPRAARMERSTHYFNPEVILGVPKQKIADLDEFYQHFGNIDASYEAVKKKYDRQINQLPLLMKQKKHIRFYEDVGVAPWRAQQIHTLLVSAFECMKSKEKKDASSSSSSSSGEEGPYAPVEDPFRPYPKLPNYECDPKKNWKSDLYAATVLSGVLAHYVADQAQPLHSTANYDGWASGNGGLHRYFEVDVVNALDEGVRNDVFRMANHEDFRRSVWRDLGKGLNIKDYVARLMILLAADSHRKLFTLFRLDEKHALQTKKIRGKEVKLASSELEWGETPSERKAEMSERGKAFMTAHRKDASEGSVQKAFREMIVERMATAVVVLAKLYTTAWQKAGMPDLSSVSQVAFEFPYQAPYIWPDFDKDALWRSRVELKTSKEKSPPSSSSQGSHSQSGQSSTTHKAPSKTSGKKAH